MSLTESPILRFSPQTAKKLIESNLFIVVTGGSGWLGQATLAMLDECFGRRINEQVFVFGSTSTLLTLPSGRSIVSKPISELALLPMRPCLLLHYAFLGKERTHDLEISEFVSRNNVISELVSEQVRRLKPYGLFIPSSGAIYRKDRTIDDNLEQNPYGVMKARDEQMFMRLAADAKIRTVVCRIFNLSGPFINKIASYAISSIIRNVLEGCPILIRADRPVFRSYFHIGDLCELVVSMLLSKINLPDEAFDTAGDETIEVGDLAKRSRDILGRSDIEILRPELVQDISPDYYVGDRKLLNVLLTKMVLIPCDLNLQILQTANYLKMGTGCKNPF